MQMVVRLKVVSQARAVGRFTKIIKPNVGNKNLEDSLAKREHEIHRYEK